VLREEAEMSLLWCPNQIRDHGLQEGNDSIRVVAGGIEMPFELDGIISFLTTQRLTRWRRYNWGTSCGLRLIVRTIDQVWEPTNYSNNFAERGEEEARTISLLSAVKKKSIQLTAGGLANTISMMTPNWKHLETHSRTRLSTKC
jgi:hypothetical protein